MPVSQSILSGGRYSYKTKPVFQTSVQRLKETMVQEINQGFPLTEKCVKLVSLHSAGRLSLSVACVYRSLDAFSYLPRRISIENHLFYLKCFVSFLLYSPTIRPRDSIYQVTCYPNTANARL